MAYTLPADVDERPVAVDGAGTLGRRIAAVYAAGGSQVRIFDPSPDQCDAAIAFCTEQVDDFKETLGPARARVGAVEISKQCGSLVERQGLRTNVRLDAGLGEGGTEHAGLILRF